MTRIRTICALAAAGAAAVAATAFGASPTGATPTVPDTVSDVVPAVAVPVKAAPKAPRCGGERLMRPEGGRYTCTFEDDFSGRSLDLSKWLVQDTSLSGFSAGAAGCYVDRPANVSQSGGVLRLTSRKEAAPFWCALPWGGGYVTDRTAATIASHTKFTQTYGRFEFRAKFPFSQTQGLHSALWLNPEEFTYGQWPHSGEIDVAEWFSGNAGQVYPSVHYQGEDPWLSTGYECMVPTANSTYHRYAVEWTPTQMRFLYDNRVCFTHSWTPDAPLSAPAPFDKPFYLVLTQVFGGGWNAFTDATPTSGTMLVDWVRVWR